MMNEIVADGLRVVKQYEYNVYCHRYDCYCDVEYDFQCGICIEGHEIGEVM
jgi:hypothetical protein